MLNIKEFLSEATTEDKLTHLEHAEDHVLNAGSAGFDHAKKTLTGIHNALQGKTSNVSISTKYDGSPSIVFGRHPESGKFFVASKSAFNKNPKINYSEKDIEENHGHAPGLVEKLKAALKHLPKVTPSKGVFQGDIMHSGVKSKDNPHGDVTLSKGQAHFTPNTITYSTHKPGESEDVKDSKIGVAVHTSYSGNSFGDLKAKFNSDAEGFTHHPDVHIINTNHETSKTKYKPEHAAEFQQHMKAAEALHKKLKSGGYDAAEAHADHLKTYINKTVRTDETPSVEGYHDHLTLHHTKAADKLKTEAGKNKILSAGKQLTGHVDKNSEHFGNLLQLHHHLQSAKNVLANALSSHTSYGHSIDGAETKPEGHVAVINNRPTKIVDRKEFSKANFAKVRG
jgi:hypothetical protein